MKKRERPKVKDNVVFFPGIVKRLTDKGLEKLHNRKFTEAIELLEEAKEHAPDNEEVLIGLVLAYFEASAFEKAKVLAKDMLLKGIGDYFQLVDLYLTLLIQLHEYGEIVSTIEALLEEKEIPTEKHEHFITLLQFSRRMADHNGPETYERMPEETSHEPKSLDLFSIHNLNEQMLMISRLTEKNIRPYVQEIATYLQAEKGHPFLKTVLLSLLKEQEYDRELAVRKFAYEEKVIPTQLPDVRHQPKMEKVKASLQTRLESSNPALVDNIVNLVDRIFFISYPIMLEPESTDAWAAAFHLLAQQYLGIDQDIDNMAAEYQVSREEMERVIEQIEQIEQISYPNI